jgi:hypothetical protein
MDAKGDRGILRIAADLVSGLAQCSASRQPSRPNHRDPPGGRSILEGACYCDGASAGH